MLTVTALAPADAVELLPDGLACRGISPAWWEAGCVAGTYLVFVAERDGSPAGLAVAESCPRRLLALALVGRGGASRLLLDRVVCAAGERDVDVWSPADRPRLGDLLRRRGFVLMGRSDADSVPSFLYHLRRNEGA
jgi:hypothetical protein